MKISLEEWHNLSHLLLDGVRNVDETLRLSPKGKELGWNGWTTGGMRMLTDGVLHELLDKLGVEVEDVE